MFFLKEKQIDILLAFYMFFSAILRLSPVPCAFCVQVPLRQAGQTLYNNNNFNTFLKFLKLIFSLCMSLDKVCERFASLLVSRLVLDLQEAFGSERGTATTSCLKSVFG